MRRFVAITGIASVEPEAIQAMRTNDMTFLQIIPGRHAPSGIGPEGLKNWPLLSGGAGQLTQAFHLRGTRIGNERSPIYAGSRSHTPCKQGLTATQQFCAWADRQDEPVRTEDPLLTAALRPHSLTGAQVRNALAFFRETQCLTRKNL